MNLGRVIVSKVLTSSTIIPLLDAGFNLNWLRDSKSGSEVVFTGIDRDAYKWILQHWDKYHYVPSVEYFREQFPKEVYTLSNNDTDSLESCQALAAEKVKSFLLAETIGQFIELHDAGKIDEAARFLAAESARINSVFAPVSLADNLNDPDFDLEGFINREVTMGVPVGIDPIDDSFYGAQPGQLITLLGRQKSGKTTMLLNSALSAWKEGYDVLFFSVEMDVDLLRQRLYSLGAHVSPTRFRMGRLKDSDKQKVRDFQEQMTIGEDSVAFRISKKKSLITVDDVISEVSLYRPHVIYIDGFNFMYDKNTKRMTENWEANEAVAAGLKALALEEQLAIFVATQVQEKQYHAKFGIEARTIMGGTGLLKASDLVIGLDKINDRHRMSSVLSRFEYFEPVEVDINWDDMSMSVIQAERIDLSGSGI